MSAPTGRSGETSVPTFARKSGARAWRSAASAGQSTRCLPMLSREQLQAPLRYPEPSRVRSSTLVSERLCRLEERREPCPCKRENHKFSDLCRPKLQVVQYFIRLSRRSAVAMSVADFSSRCLPAYCHLGR